MARPDFLSPVMMSAQIEDPVSPTASVSLTLPPYAFLNPNKSPMLVDQLRLSVGNYTEQAEGFMRRLKDSKIDIMMGGIPLTNGLIPIPSLFPLYLGDKSWGLARSGTYIFSASDNPIDYSTTLHLEKPLYVPYGTTFQIRIAQSAGTEFPGGFTFSMHGRSCPNNFKRPEKIWVPWCAGFKVPDADASGGLPIEYTCQDNDMPNPFPTPLYIRHLQGYGTQTRGNNTDFNIQITTSSNKLLIRDPTPFQMLFPDDRLILPFSAKLDPREFLRVELSTPGGFFGDSVGMVGFREIPTPFAPGE